MTEMYESVQKARTRQLYKELITITQSDNYMTGWRILHEVDWTMIEAEALFSGCRNFESRVKRLIHFQPIYGLEVLKYNFDTVLCDMLAAKEGIRQVTAIIKHPGETKRAN